MVRIPTYLHCGCTPRLFARCAVTAVLSGAFSSCSGTTLLNWASSNGAYSARSEHAYGVHERQHLDIYEPAASSASPAPVVVFFYGGGWRDGSKDMYEFVGSSLAREGIVVVVPDYRLWPEVRYPVFVEDAAAAVAWVQREIERFGGDREQIFVAGHSAGAYMAALVALDERYLIGAGGDPDGLAGLAALSGPYDFLPLDEGSYLQDVFPVPLRDGSQPLEYASSRALPMLLVHGMDDERVLPLNSVRISEKARTAGSAVRLRLYPGVGHARVVAALAPLLDWVAPTRRDLLEWLSSAIPRPELVEDRHRP